MKPYIVENRDQLNTISEICKKCLKKKLTTCPKIIRKVKPSQKEIKAIALKKTPLYKRRKSYNLDQAALFYPHYYY